MNKVECFLQSCDVVLSFIICLLVVDGISEYKILHHICHGSAFLFPGIPNNPLAHDYVDVLFTECS